MWVEVQPIAMTLAAAISGCGANSPQFREITNNAVPNTGGALSAARWMRVWICWTTAGSRIDRPRPVRRPSGSFKSF